MKVVIFILLFIICGLIYILGFIPKTTPYYEKKFNEFYLGLLSASSCDEVLFWINYQEDPNFIQYIRNNDLWIQKKYPKQLLAQHINPMNCTDKYGNVVVF